ICQIAVRECYLLKELFRQIMARSQVTLDIALRWSADAGRNLVLLTLHSAGVKTFDEGTLFQYLSLSEKRVTK
ncbi:MAG: hypothetical protein OXI86_02665, partial [Candidatus Poribacteria bacterium]|nr:hypothetical protein [Candidatus Poribacteria bacterium]